VGRVRKWGDKFGWAFFFGGSRAYIGGGGPTGALGEGGLAKACEKGTSTRKPVCLGKGWKRVEKEATYFFMCRVLRPRILNMGWEAENSSVDSFLFATGVLGIRGNGSGNRDLSFRRDDPTSSRWMDKVGNPGVGFLFLLEPQEGK